VATAVGHLDDRVTAVIDGVDHATHVHRPADACPRILFYGVALRLVIAKKLAVVSTLNA
jgi:hypothetical protein